MWRMENGSSLLGIAGARVCGMHISGLPPSLPSAVGERKRRRWTARVSESGPPPSLPLDVAPLQDGLKTWSRRVRPSRRRRRKKAFRKISIEYRKFTHLGMAQAADAVSDEEGKKEKGSFTLRARKHEKRKKDCLCILWRKSYKTGKKGKGEVAVAVLSPST